MENNQKNKTELNTQSTTSTPETKKSPKVKVCEICQRSDILLHSTIEQALKDHSNCIEKYAYILHDKDIDQNGNPVNPHFHIILKFNKDDGRTLKHVASWFGVEEQYVLKSTSTGRNKFQDMCRFSLPSPCTIHIFYIASHIKTIFFRKYCSPPYYHLSKER